MKYRIPGTLQVWPLMLASLSLQVGAQTSAQERQVNSLFYAPDTAVDTLQPNRSDMRIPQRMQGRVVVRAARAVSVDPSLQAPPQDMTQRTFSLDAVRMLEDTQFDEGELMEVMAPWTDRPLSFAEFQLAGVTLLEYLQAHGHPDAVLRFSQMEFMEGQRVAVAIGGLERSDNYQNGSPRIHVAGFDVHGVTLLSAAEIEEHMASFSGRELSLDELSLAAESLSGLLRERGYGLAQAWLPPQEIEDGRIRIDVLEGVVDADAGKAGLTIAGGGRVREEVITGYLARSISPGQPLNVQALERSVRQVNELPGIQQLQVDLAPGAQPGTTQVLAEVDDERLLTVALTADNYGSRLTGEDRAGINVNLNSALGYGEQMFLNYMESAGTHSYKVGLHTPVGFGGWRIGLSHAALDVSLNQGAPDLRALNITSDSDITSVFANYALLRSATTQFDVFASIDHKNFSNNYLTLSQEFDRDVDAATLGFSGSHVDNARGRSAWGLSLTHGNFSINQVDPVLAFQAERTASSFTKANLNVSRLQSLPLDKWYLYSSLTAQYASDNMDSVEKFQLGGPLGVRAWPVGEGIGDHGWLANVELRRGLGTLVGAEVEGFGFYDAGGIQQFASDPLPDERNHYMLSGFGLGLSFNFAETGRVSLVYARKDRNNPNPTLDGNDTDGSRRSGRLWLIGNILF